MPSNSEHIAKWNMRTLAEGSEPKQRTDVRSMSHEVNTLRPHRRQQQNKGPPKLGRVTFVVLRCLFVLSDAWEGINIGMDEPTAASPERCATGYFEAQKVQNRLVVTHAWQNLSGLFHQSSPIRYFGFVAKRVNIRVNVLSIF